MRHHELTHDVYFDDLDAFQILHNARYLLLFERTIGSFWRQYTPSRVLTPELDPDQYHVVRANQLEYLRPVRGVGDVRVRIWVEKLGRTSLTFAMRVLPVDQDEVYCKGSRVIVRVNPETYRPEPWSDSFRERIAPYVHELQ